MKHDNKTIDHDGFLLVKDYWNHSNFTGKVKFPAGDKFWYKNGGLHREDGPAVEFADGSIDWYYNGARGLEHFPPELKKKLARRFLHGA